MGQRGYRLADNLLFNVFHVASDVSLHPPAPVEEMPSDGPLQEIDDLAEFVFCELPVHMALVRLLILGSMPRIGIEEGRMPPVEPIAKAFRERRPDGDLPHGSAGHGVALKKAASVDLGLPPDRAEKTPN